MSSIASVMPTPDSDLAWPSLKAAGAVSSRASRASTSASVAGVYQSPGRNHTESMLAVCQVSRSAEVPTVSVRCSLRVMAYEPVGGPRYDATPAKEHEMDTGRGATVTQAT